MKIPETYNELKTSDFIELIKRGWLRNFDVLNKLPQPDIDIGTHTLGQKILLQSIIDTTYSQTKDVTEAMMPAVQIYFPDKNPDNKIIEIFPIFSKLISELERILKLESQLKTRFTDEQIRAGIKKFDQFGHFSTLYALSKHLGIPITEVEKLDYYTAYNVLKYENISYEYQSKLNEIHHKKHSK